PTQEQLEQFERSLPHPLPADFRAVLVRYSGGADLGPCSTGLRDGLEREVRIDTLHGLREGALDALEYGDKHIPSDVLVFSHQYGTINRFGIQLADRPESPRGTVWFFDSDAPTETEDLYVPSACAASFSAFLAQLTPLVEAVPDPEASDSAPGSSWHPPEVREKAPADAPTPEKPLVLAGQAHAVVSARLGIQVNTWIPDAEWRAYGYHPDRATVRYWLELEGADQEGEDGAPAPGAQDLPVARANGGRHPTLAEWSTLVVGPEGDWDAWYGNDAPALVENRLTVLGRSGADLMLRWEASYSEYGHDLTFLFEGPVRFDGIRFDVEDPADIERVLASAFGGAHRPGEWTRQVGERRSLGAAPARSVLPVTLVPHDAS
ncbi:SMI1/KNR4 family protein, partial [Corallococcus llansteffanensis]